MLLHIIKLTVERNESQINRSVERQHHVQRVNSFTEKQKSVQKRKQLCDITYAELYIMAANV
jgi:hypothetical protein